MNKLIVEEKRGNVHYKICRKSSGETFTDYVIYRISSKSSISPFFAGLTDRAFDDIFELGKYYFLRSEKFYSGFAFMDSRLIKDILFDDSFEETGKFLNPIATMTFNLNRLSDDGKIRLNKDGFICKAGNKEIEDSLNFWLRKGYLKADPRTNENVIFKFIHPALGNISKAADKNSMIVNSNFFVLETKDMNSPCSLIGQPFGALIGDGKVMLPPLFKREVLLRYKNGKSDIKKLDISDATVVIGNTNYKNGDNATFFRRPDFKRTPSCNGTDLIIVNGEMMAFKKGGNSLVPDAGFVIQIPSEDIPSVTRANYFLNDSVDFAVQAGPSLVADGKPMNRIQGEFNSLVSENHTGISFPPNVFETEWDTSKASRIGLGFSDEVCVVLWVAGCNAGEYIEGYDSEGFTFKEMTEIMLSEGVKNAVSLDGGGSSQVRNGMAKVLKLADRRGLKGHEFERPTPVGIKITF